MYTDSLAVAAIRSVLCNTPMLDQIPIPAVDITRVMQLKLLTS